jgi:hypothetical protein
MTGSRVDFCYKIGARPFVIALLHGSTGFHISNIDEDFITHRVYEGGLLGVYSHSLCNVAEIVEQGL